MYPKRPNGSEYYPNFPKDKYQVNETGDEIYVKLKDGSEKYLKKRGLDIVARKKNSKGETFPYFALDDSGNPICPVLEPDMKYIRLDIAYPRNSKNKELYPKLKNTEYYIFKHGQCVYAKDELNREYYATKALEEYYAFKVAKNGDWIEYPILDERGDPRYIMREGTVLYPFNNTTSKPIYPVDTELNETYAEKNGVQFYATSPNSIFPVYAKNKNGDEILAYHHSMPFYAFAGEGGLKTEYYPKLSSNKEYYLEHENKTIYAKYPNLDEYYAKTEQDGHYLAEDRNIPYYAISHLQIEIYPSDRGGNNFYRTVHEKEVVAKNKLNGEGFFPTNVRNDEFYPKSFRRENENEFRVEAPPTRRTPPTLKDIFNHQASVP